MLITTFDCKIFLLKKFPDKDYQEWKRVRKFKNENKDVCREFVNNGFTVILIERHDELTIGYANRTILETKIKIPFEVNFSFLDDANCDEIEYLEEIAENKDYKAKIRDIAIFFIPKDASGDCNHLEPLIGEYLPNYFYETEEMAFQSINKNLSVKQVFDDLIDAGFVYDCENCVLKDLFSN